jgi:hypothetical protein
MNLIPNTVPQITFSSINCNSLNMSEQTSLHHLIKLYGVVKLKTDVIFMSDIRLKNARGVANITKTKTHSVQIPTVRIDFSINRIAIKGGLAS